MLSAILLSSAMATPLASFVTSAQETPQASDPEENEQVSSSGNQPKAGDRTPNAFDQDIVVTANRREERLQRVPIAVTAITADELAVSGIASNVQLAQKTPSLQMTYTGGAVLPYIRGIGSNNPSPGDEPPIATYIDGVYQSRSYATNFSFNNIDRVEVLKGPQGTLFGRNAAGGLIQVITRDPSSKTGVEGSVSYGNYDTTRVQTYLTTGIANSLAADLAIYYSNQARGYGRNLFTGDSYGKGRDFAVRSKWAYSDAENKIVLSVDYRDLATDRPLGLRSPPGTKNIYGELPPSNFQDINTTQDPDMKIKSWGVSLNARHNVGFADLVSISSYRYASLSYRQDGDTSPTDGIFLVASEKVRTFTQELQLKSNSSGPLKWSAGLFYLRDASGYTPFTVSGLDIGSTIDIWSRIKTDSYSAYLDATYRLAPRTEITGGVRYTIDTRSAAGFNAISSPTGDPITSTPEVNVRKSFKSPTWRFIVNQTVGSDSILYGSYSRGFKSGGFAAASIADPPFKSAYIDSFELGSKNKFANGVAGLNVAAFLYKYNDIQVQQIVPPGVQHIVNAGQATGKGIEVDAYVRPVKNLRLTVGYAYLDATYDKFSNGLCTQALPGGGNAVLICPDLAGKRLPRAPRNTLNLALDHSLSTSVGTFTTSLSWYWNEGYFSDADNRLKQPAYSVANINFGWRSTGQRFGIDLFMHNVTDAKYYDVLVEQTVNDTYSPAPPRTFGVQFSFKY